MWAFSKLRVIAVLCFVLAGCSQADSDDPMYSYYKKDIIGKEIAAKEGYVDAQTTLGMYYYQGLGVKPDHKKGKYWYELAAKQGYAEAQYELGEVYTIENNPEKAKYWYELAAKQVKCKQPPSSTDCGSEVMAFNADLRRYADLEYYRCLKSGVVESGVDCGNISKAIINGYRPTNIDSYHGNDLYYKIQTLYTPTQDFLKQENPP